MVIYLELITLITIFALTFEFESPPTVPGNTEAIPMHWS